MRLGAFNYVNHGQGAFVGDDAGEGATGSGGDLFVVFGLREVINDCGDRSLREGYGCGRKRKETKGLSPAPFPAIARGVEEALNCQI
jgi:hypothetical protein